MESTLNMQTSEEILQSKDGLKLHGKCWLPDQAPETVICLVHGHGEHIGRYDELATYFNSQNIGFYGIDMRGHGLSEGKRGHIPSYELVMSDIEELLKWARVEHHDARLILYGHSLGGNYVAHFALTNEIKELAGVVISAPWLELALVPPKSKVTLANFARHIYPSLLNSTGLDANGLSHDQTIIDKYLNDPLVHDQISANLFYLATMSGANSLEKVANLRVPALIMHGNEDPITSAAASQQFAEKANITFKLWEGMKHEIHNEIGKKEVWDYTINWIEKHLPAAD
jgi:alpha-beta hydrolase superfamily lysophospholipase